MTDSQTLDRIIPRPLRVAPADGAFVIASDTLIVATDEESKSRAQQLADALAPATGWKPRVSIGPAPTIDCITLRIDPYMSELGDEGYRAMITPRRIDLVARRSAGLFWAVQTIRQLLPVEIFSTTKVNTTWSIPCGEIDDVPRFGWRGLMLDCCRHFMPIEFVRKFIDVLSLHKLNVFHWHLTEDQGWRIEIRKYPKLTEVGAWRAETLTGHSRDAKQSPQFDGQRHGGFYTQAEVRELVKFAAERNVTIVPEIEMPGHAQAAIAAYPELGNTNEPQQVWTRWGVNPNILNVEESTIRFMQDVLDEVTELFPSKYVHLGGDEAPKEQWKASSRAQARIRALGLKNEDELQSWFMRRMGEHLGARGRRWIGWDEILEGGLTPGATVMSWRGEKGGVAAARAGHDVVMAPNDTVYFDHYQSEDKSKEPLAIGGVSPIEKGYAYEPIPAGLNDREARFVLGAQGQIWTEYIPTPAHAECMAYPRACALSEALWSPKPATPPRDFATFRLRLDLHLKRLGLLNVNYRPLS